MVNHPNRNWRKQWAVDLSACTATHANGFTMTYEQTSDDHIDGKFDNANEWLKTQDDMSSSGLQRLIKESGIIYKEALDKRN